MGDYISKLAAVYETTHEDMLERLKAKYDGYHFAWPSPDIFNPFCIMKVFAFNRMEYFWFESGTPTYQIEMLRKYNIVPSKIGGFSATASSFDAPTERMTNITPLLYQSGYLTIKDYNKAGNLYKLDIPNNEIRTGLMQSLLPNYVSRAFDEGLTTVAQMYISILEDDMEGALDMLREFLLTVPQCDNTNYEGHYQQMLYVIFSLLGQYVDVEVRTAKGRVDIVMRTATKLYLIELKINGSAEEALNQIDLKNYPARFTLHNLPIVKVGINFSTEERTLTDWKITE